LENASKWLADEASISMSKLRSLRRKSKVEQRFQVAGRWGLNLHVQAAAVIPSTQVKG
jgi:hypothetical protein